MLVTVKVCTQNAPFEDGDTSVYKIWNYLVASNMRRLWLFCVEILPPKKEEGFG